ncbi:AAA family ATPase [Paraburkholderia bannensis]|uniref:AAA family ATPase n=1 Tax=Paraburkholderia bannensis TaxID=765414 RepID=UPI0038B9D7B4
MPAISKLTIAGYKSIRELREFELRDLNVLIGTNGSGKSNFIGFFRMLAEMYGQRLQLHVAKQGGPDALLHYGQKRTPHIQAELSFGDTAAGYFFALEPAANHRLIFENEGIQPGENSKLRIRSHAESWLPEADRMLDSWQGAGLHIDAQTRKAFAAMLPPIDRIRVYHFHDTSDTAKVKQVCATNDNLRLKSDASNLAPFLRMLREQHEGHYQAIVDSIRLVAPFFDNFVYREDNPANVELEWLEQGDPDTPFKAHVLSDGTLRFICLATLLLQPVELMPPIILLDEPELGLHPFAINVLADLLKLAAEQTQLIVATQSVPLLSCLEPEDVIVVDRKDNASTFRRLSEAELGTWLDDYSLGELWEMNVLGGRPA